jgi:hypothetical protein
MSAHLRLNNGEEDEDRANPYYSKYYGKFCDASFSPSELEIIATGYSCTDNPDHNCEQYKVLFFDGSGGFPHAYNRISFINTSQPVNRKPAAYKEIYISPDEKIAAVILSDSVQIALISAWGTSIKNIIGFNPMFSASGRVLYWINGNRINKFPVNPHEINGILREFKITSKTVSKEKDMLEI